MEMSDGGQSLSNSEKDNEALENEEGKKDMEVDEALNSSSGSKDEEVAENMDAEDKDALEESFNQDILDEISEFNDAEEIIEEGGSSDSEVSYRAIQPTPEKIPPTEEVEKESSMPEKTPKESTSITKTNAEATTVQLTPKEKYIPNGTLETLVEKLVRKEGKGPSKESNDSNQSKASNEVSSCLEEGCNYETRKGKDALKRHRRLKHLVGPIPQKESPCPFKECFYSTQIHGNLFGHIKEKHNIKGKVRTWWFHEEDAKDKTPPKEQERPRYTSPINTMDELKCSYDGCPYLAVTLTGLKKHITQKHLKPRGGANKRPTSSLSKPGSRPTSRPTSSLSEKVIPSTNDEVSPITNKRKDTDTDSIDTEEQKLKKIKLVRTPSESGWRPKQEEEPAVRARSTPVRFRDEQAEEAAVRVRAAPKGKELTSFALPNIKKCHITLENLRHPDVSLIVKKKPKKSYEKKPKSKHIATDNLMNILLQMSKLKDGHTWSRVYSEDSRPNETNSVIYDLIEEHANNCDVCPTHLNCRDFEIKRTTDENLEVGVMKAKIARLEEKLSAMTEKMAKLQSVEMGEFPFRDLLTGVNKPQLLKRNDYTVKKGFRLIDIHVFRLALASAQGCGHNNLMIAEANTSMGQEDLATQMALLCSVCGNQTIFTSSSYSDEEPTNYSINKSLLPLLGPGAYYNLCSFVQKSENSLPVHIKAPRYAHVGQKAKLIMSLDKNSFTNLDETFQVSNLPDDANICEPAEPEEATRVLGPTTVIKPTSELVLGSKESSSQVIRPMLALRPTSTLTQTLKEKESSSQLERSNDVVENTNPPVVLGRLGLANDARAAQLLQANRDSQQRQSPPVVPSSSEPLTIQGGHVTLVAPGTKIVAHNVVHTTTSKVKLPGGVYKFTKTDGTESVLIVKEDEAAASTEADDDIVEIVQDSPGNEPTTYYKTPLQMFSTEVSEAIKKQLPQLSSYQVQKIVIDRWAKMSDREKHNYKQKSLDDMNRYPKPSSANADPKNTPLMANVSSIAVTNGGTSSLGSLANARSLLKEQLQSAGASGNEKTTAGRIVHNNSGKKMVKMKLNGPDGVCKEILVPAVDGPNGTLKVAIPRNYSVPPGGQVKPQQQQQQVIRPQVLPRIAPRPTLQAVSIGGGEVKDMNNFLEVNVGEDEMHYEDPDEEEADEDVDEVEKSDSDDGDWSPSKENMSQKRKRPRY